MPAPVPALQQPASRPVSAVVAEADNPLRKLGLYFALATLFVRFSVLPEAIFFHTGVNTYLLYIVAPPALLLMLITGGAFRTFRRREPVLLVLFLLWMVAAVPTSHWPGGSLARVISYARTEFMLLFIVAGLVVSWKDVRAVLNTMALAGLVNMVVIRLSLRLESGRMSLDYQGTIANSNDLAAHLLLMMPFLLYVLMDSKRSFLIRIPMLGAIAYGLYVVLGTASRGALVATAACVLFSLWKASARQRMAVLLLFPALLVPALMFAPQSTIDRLKSLTGSEHKEADESAASRKYLFQQSLIFTLQHPIFGVGPDQFANYEGKTRTDEGLRGNWHAAHCSWTQVSSECGIPAFLFYAGAILGAGFLVNRTYREARKRMDSEVATACFCFLLSMVGYFVAITFLSNAYSFRQPAMVGMAMVIAFAAQDRFARSVAPSPRRT